MKNSEPEQEMKYEIERKYLLNRLPENLGTYRHIEIEQGYISTTPVVRIRKKITHPGSGDTTDASVENSVKEAVKESYVLTIKSSGMLSRQEYEMDITGEEYENLKPKVEGNVITKTRYVIPLTVFTSVVKPSPMSHSNTDAEPDSDNPDAPVAGSNVTTDGLVLELDMFEGAFSGLVMGEIEFPNQKTADSFETAEIFSDFISSEVTFDKRFHNSTMSAMSQGEIRQFIDSLQKLS